MKHYFKTLTLFALGLAFIIPAGDVYAIPTYEDACEVPLLSSRLTVGSRNQDVQDLQEFLVEQDLLPESSVSGYYGPLTRQAVRQFQANEGIVSSGTAATTGFGAVGARTLAAINRIACEDVREAGGGTTTGTTSNQRSVNLTADKTSITPGQSVTLSWNTTGNPTSCSTTFDVMTLDSAKQGTKTLSPTSSVTYVVTCSFPGNQISGDIMSDSVRIVVGEAGDQGTSGVLPTVTLSVGQSSVQFERSTSITWSSTNATRCVPSGAWGPQQFFPGTMPMSGSLFSTGALTAPVNSFTITCFNSAGQSATDTKIVSVTGNATNSNLTVNLTANGSTNPSSIAVGAPTLLEWSVVAPTSGITTCTGSGSGIGSNGIDSALWNGGKTQRGTMTARPLVTTTYTLSCVSGGQTVAASVTVPVTGTNTPISTTTPATGPRITSFVATPGNTFGTSGPGAIPGQAYTLSWTSAGASNCVLWSGTERGIGGILPANGSYNLNIFNASAVYELKCYNNSVFALDTASRSVTLTLDLSTRPGPALTFTASSNTATVNLPLTLTWSSPTATSCTGGGDGSLELYVNSTSGSRTFSFFSPGTFTMSITCRSANGGSTTRTQTVVVSPSTGTGTGTGTSQSGNALGVDISANGSDGPVTLSAGQQLNLSWGMRDVSSVSRSNCSVSGDSNFTGTKYPVGNLTIDSPRSATYAITCRDIITGSVGSDSVTVNVSTSVNTDASAPVTLEVRANGAEGPVTITRNSPFIPISWRLNALNDAVTSTWTCSLSGAPGASNVPYTSNDIMRFLDVRPSVTTTYGVSCTSRSTGQTLSDTVTVIVQ